MNNFHAYLHLLDLSSFSLLQPTKILYRESEVCGLECMKAWLGIVISLILTEARNQFQLQSNIRPIIKVVLFLSILSLFNREIIN